MQRTQLKTTFIPGIEGYILPTACWPAKKCTDPPLIDISSGFIRWYRKRRGVLVCRKARGSLRSCGWSVFSVATHRAYQSWESLLIQLWRPRLTLLQVSGVDIAFETSPHRSRLGIMMMVLAKERKKKYTPSLPWLIMIVKSFEKQVSTSFKMLMLVSRHHFQMLMRREHQFRTKRHSGCWLMWELHMTLWNNLHGIFQNFKIIFYKNQTRLFNIQGKK